MTFRGSGYGTRVNSFVPLFRDLVETRGGHAELMFRAMLQLAGALTAFSDRIRHADLPLYGHEDLGPRFKDLDEKVRILLETIIHSNVVSLRLLCIDTAQYGAAIDQEEYLSGTRMYLAIQAEMPKSERIRKAPQLIEVSSKHKSTFLFSPHYRDCE
jgi:type VI secretion system protein ImpJ